MKPGKRKRYFVLNFFSCFLIPVYTISFAGSTEWFGSNFSVIAVTGWDHYRGFLYWGLLAGSYFLVVVNRLAFSLPGHWARLAVSWLVLAACLALGYALAIPYLPDYFPRFAALPAGGPAYPAPAAAGAVRPPADCLGPDRAGERRAVFDPADGVQRSGGVFYHLRRAAGPEALHAPAGGTMNGFPSNFYGSLI